MKKLILATLVAASAFASSASYAACSRFGYVERVTAQGSGTVYVYLRPVNPATSQQASLVNYYYYAATTDIKIANAATAAATSRTWVYLSGNAANCPAANGSMGGITTLIVAP